MHSIYELSVGVRIFLYYLYSLALSLYAFYYIRRFSPGSPRFLRSLPILAVGYFIGPFFFIPKKETLLALTTASWHGPVLFRLLALCFDKGQASRMNTFLAFLCIFNIPIDINMERSIKKDSDSSNVGNISESKDLVKEVKQTEKTDKPKTLVQRIKSESQTDNNTELVQKNIDPRSARREKSLPAWKVAEDRTLVEILGRFISFNLLFFIAGPIYWVFIQDYYGKVFQYFCCGCLLLSATIQHYVIWETGVHFYLANPALPLFVSPYKSEGLSDLWGNRWNLTMARKLRVGVYLPVVESMVAYRTGGGKNDKPNYTERAIGVIMTFVVSGIFHEMLMFWAVGKHDWTGVQFWFFMIHGFLIVFEQWLRVNGVAVSGWMAIFTTLFICLCTSSFFFEPYIETGLCQYIVNDFDKLMNFSGLGRYLGITV